MTHAAARCQRVERLSADDHVAGILFDKTDVGVWTCEEDLESCLSSCLVCRESELEALLSIEIRFRIYYQEWSFCFCHAMFLSFLLYTLCKKHAVVPFFESIIIDI